MTEPKAEPRKSAKIDVIEAALADAITAHIRGNATERREAVARLVAAL